MSDIDLALSKPKILTTMCHTIQLSLDSIKCEDDITTQSTNYGINSATIVVWMVQGIYWGILTNGKISLLSDEHFDINLLLEMRIFNDEVEMRIVRRGKYFYGRVIIDNSNDISAKKCEYVDAISRLWGKSVVVKESSVILKDVDRKLSMEIPVSNLDSVYYGLVTRNYIGINNITYQAGYVDYRYLRISSADIKKGDK